MLQERQFNQWMSKASQTYLADGQRQIYLTRILSILMQSDQLWHDPHPCYEEALLQTLSQFCQQFNTSITDAHLDWEWTQVIDDLNQDLRQRLQILQSRYLPLRSIEMPDCSESLSLPQKQGQADGGESSSLVAQLYEWVKLDFKGDLRRTHLNNYPEMTCQILIEKRLSPEQSWEEIAAESGIPIATLSHFYQRECLPRLRRFAMARGELQQAC